MRFELINAKRTCELSRKAFIRMLSGALEISDDFSQGNSFDGYTCKRKKFWLFLDLGIKLVVYYDSLKDIEYLMKEIKDENEKKTVNKDYLKENKK